MRQGYIVTYDVCNPKRLRKVFKTMQGYGEHLQLSVLLRRKIVARRSRFCESRGLTEKLFDAGISYCV